MIKIGRGPGTVIGRGVITGVGVEENNRFDLPPGSTFQVTFHFPEGDLYMDVVPGPPQVDFNPNSCVTRITLHPTTTVTGGTGAYEGASGSGTATSHILVIAGRAEDGSCLSPSAPPISRCRGFIRPERSPCPELPPVELWAERTRRPTTATQAAPPWPTFGLCAFRWATDLIRPAAASTT